MKKTVSIVTMFVMFLVVLPLSPIGHAEATSPPAASSAGIKRCPAGTFRVRKNTKRGRKLTNALIAGGIGAAVGGGLGGGRGALLGAGAGSGGYLTYRYVKDRRGRCVPRRVR